MFSVAANCSLMLPPEPPSAGFLLCLTERYGAAFDRQIRDQMSGDIVPFLVMINETVYRTTTDLGVSLTEGDAVTVMIPFDGG